MTITFRITNVRETYRGIDQNYIGIVADAVCAVLSLNPKTYNLNGQTLSDADSLGAYREDNVCLFNLSKKEDGSFSLKLRACESSPDESFEQKVQSSFEDIVLGRIRKI